MTVSPQVDTISAMAIPLLPAGSPRLIIAKNTVSQLLGRVISSLSMFAATVLIARAFGVQGYGDFVKITSFVALFYLAADFGMNAVYVKKAHAKVQARQSNTLWSTLFGLRLVGSIMLVFVAVAVLAFLPQGVHQGYTSGVRLGIVLFAPSIIFQAIVTTANAVFQQKLRYDLATWAVALGSIITVLFVWLVSITVSPPLGAVVSSSAVLLGIGLSALVSVFLVRRFVRISIALDPSPARELFTASVPLGLTLLFNQIYFRADSIILALNRPTSEVGLYGFAYKIFDVALVVPTFFMNSVYPIMIKHTNEANAGQLKTILKKSSVFLVIGSLVLVGIFWAVAPLLVLVRSEFSGSVWALRILALSLPFFFISSLTMWTLISLGKQLLLIPIYAASMFANILLNVLLIPSYGYVAAAWITVGSEGLVLLASALYLRRALHYSTVMSRESTNDKSTNMENE